MPSLTAADFARLPSAVRERALAELSPSAIAALRHDWRFWARPEQLAPGSEGAANPRADWAFWMVCAGRFFGKTRLGAEWTNEKARDNPGCKINLVAPTAGDARKVMLSDGLEGIEGASGILAVSPPDFRPHFESSKNLLTWPNGSVAEIFSAEEPNRIRGPQCHFAWVDEIAAWAKEHGAWQQLLFGMRLGQRPQACITTTPRPIPIVRSLLANPATVVTRGRSRDNAANVAPTVFDEILIQFEGTRLGRQELDGEILDDTPGALWQAAMLDALRVKSAPDLIRIVVAIDPAVSSGAGSDETGIVVAGIGPCACKGEAALHGFVLDDLSGRHTPDAWARAAVSAYRARGASRIVAEVNNGGALVEVNLRTVDPNAAYRAVHASTGKHTRAEPVAALYEQGRIHHVGMHAALEDQMTTWDPMTSRGSPDRVDACFVAGTRVRLKRGNVPIEEVQAGDLALTRAGWRRVKRACMTSPSSPTVTVETSDGRTLTGTRNHPVWVVGRGFVPLDSLSRGEGLITCRIESRSRASSTVAIPTPSPPPIGAIGAPRAEAGRKTSTSRSGSPSTGQSRADTTSTTRIRTRSTTTSATSSASRQSNTPQRTQPITMTREANGSEPFAHSPPSGTEAQSVGRGTPSTVSAHGSIGNCTTAPARDAGAHSSPHSPMPVFARSRAGIEPPSRRGDTQSPSTAQFVTGRSRDTSTGQSRKRARVFVVRSYASAAAPVWNLEVEGQPEYFANGVLVHNCVWAITDLMLSASSGTFAMPQSLSPSRAAAAEYQGDDFDMPDHSDDN